MTQQQAPINVTSFVKGFITEASPLTFPDQASLDERNFVLNRDGSRNRRLGMAAESESQVASVYCPNAVYYSNENYFGFRSYLWKNVANIANKSFSVLQIGSKLIIKDVSYLNGNPIFVGHLSDSGVSCSISAVNGVLAVADGSSAIRIYTYNQYTHSITESSNQLFIRDLFGIEDGLLSQNTVDTRPGYINSHIYNLYNQGWAYPRYNGNGESLTDPISAFNSSAGAYPSNSDTVLSALYADANDSDDRITKRFFPKDLIANPLGSYRAACGYFIINALSRGASRRSAIASLRSKYAQVAYDPTGGILDDYTSGGYTTLCQYSGRMFYSGVTGQTVSGDAQSPSLQSYVLFSTLVSSPSDLSICYQSGDPTSEDSADVVDTDGGFIRLDGAAGIMSMHNLGDSLIVLASNGVWQITGGGGYGFSATDYKVARLSDRACISSTATVQVDNGLIFFGQDGIYTVAKDNLGDYTVNNITVQTIQTYYNALDAVVKKGTVGFFDGYERKVHWILRNSIASTEETQILHFDVDLAAFYKDYVAGTHQVIGYVQMPSYALYNNLSASVTYNGAEVEYNTTPVNYVYGALAQTYRESYYIYSSGVSLSSSQYSLAIGACQFINEAFLDWGTTDAAAYLVTGYTSGGDFQREKFVPYLHVFCKRTETGWDSNYNLVGQSSCKVQSQWEWTNSANSKRWGSTFEAYRLRRPWIPSTFSDEYDDGHPVITTRNTLRGHGKVLSIKFSTTAGKNLYLYGWSMIANVNGNI